jgi:hypothetical protein
MSSPTDDNLDQHVIDPEYDEGELDELLLEPGMPDEAVAAYEAQPIPEYGFNQELAAELLPLLAATVLAMFVVEAVLKPLAKTGFDTRYKKQRKEDPTLPEKRDTAADKHFIRGLTFLAGCGTSVTFGFRAMVYDLTGYHMSMLEAVLYGGSSVAVCALVIYMLIEEMRPVKALKVFIRGIYGAVFQRFVGREMTDDEKAELDKTNRKMEPVDPAMFHKPEATDDSNGS